MLSANFLAGIHFLPVPARSEPGPCGRKHFGNGERAETLRIMSGKPAGAEEESCTTMKLSPSCRQQKAKLILTSCEAFFSANPALTRESQLGPSQKALGKVRGFAYIQGHGHGLPEQRPRSWASLQTSVLLSPEGLSTALNCTPKSCQPSKKFMMLFTRPGWRMWGGCLQTHPDWGQIPA